MAVAQQPTLPLPFRAEKIESVKVGETRPFWVSLPDGYNENSEAYPVIYMMDGDFNFNSGVIGGLRYGASLGEIPEFIIVGIKNTNRGKDIYAEEVTYADGSKEGGRAGQYLDFIQTELIPYIEKNYRTQNYRVLFGTSNTGYTTVHALFHRPEIASAYIAASATLSIPSFRDGRDKLIKDFAGGKRHLVLVMGEDDFPTVLVHNSALKEKIGTLAPADLTCQLTVIEHGPHVPPASLLTGIHRLFEGWSLGSQLTASNFPEIRDQVERRMAKYGVTGKLPESDLQSLGDSLLGERKAALALTVCRYRVESYPRSAEAQVSMGDAFRQNGEPDKARLCYQ